MDALDQETGNIPAPRETQDLRAFSISRQPQKVVAVVVAVAVADVDHAGHGHGHGDGHDHHLAFLLDARLELGKAWPSGTAAGFYRLPIVRVAS
jgi:hypothetical protein